MKTLVVSNVHRPALVLPHVKHLNPIVGLTCDYPHAKIGQARCRMGTANVLKMALGDDPNEDRFLTFEDDCQCNDQYDWWGAVNVASEILGEGEFNAICLHGRGWQNEPTHNKFKAFQKGGWNWLYPTIEHHWIQGTLVHLLNREAAQQFVDADFWLDGTFIDHFLWSTRFKWCLLESGEKVFIHDRSQGSLLENSKNTEFVNR